MLQATVEIEGLDQLRSRLGDSRILDAELRKAETESVAAVKQQAKDNAGAFSSVLPASVQSDIQSGGLSAIIGSVAKTALSIELGRKKGEMPSFEAVQRWMVRRGVGASMTVRGHRYVKPRKNSSEAAQMHDDAVGIAFKIRDSGTKPLPFIIPAATLQQDKVKGFFGEAVTRALKRWAGK